MRKLEIPGHWQGGQVILNKAASWPEGSELRVTGPASKPVILNVKLPFFAYGVFKPGQLAFFQIKEFVSHVKRDYFINGSLHLRDGLPFADQRGQASVRGEILEFKSDDAAEMAYQQIFELEPDKVYEMRLAEASPWPGFDGVPMKVNVMFGKEPDSGLDTGWQRIVDWEDGEWDGSKDPLFTTALELVDETFADTPRYEFGEDIKLLFRLEMAYLLLWSAIERYLSLRYDFGESVSFKVKKLSDESAFCQALLKHGPKENEERRVCRANDPGKAEILDRKKPKKAACYYYQLRSNIVHRGKGALDDY